MNIFLIAGHGAGDSGAVANGYREADLTREVTTRIPEYLGMYADVTVGDMSRDWFSWLKTNSFNFRPYQYVLEIHFNAGANDLIGDGRITGTEIYVTDSEAEVTVEEEILSKMSDIGFTNRGIKRRNFSVISKVKAQGVSSALLEVAFVDDRDDMELYERSKDEIARAIAEGIAVGFDLNKEEGDLTMGQYEELLRRIDEIEARINSENMIYNYIDENMPEWARPTIIKLVEKGWLRGEDGRLGLTDQMLRIFVVNDRAGLYGE